MTPEGLVQTNPTKSLTTPQNTADSDILMVLCQLQDNFSPKKLSIILIDRREKCGLRTQQGAVQQQLHPSEEPN